MNGAPRASYVDGHISTFKPRVPKPLATRFACCQGPDLICRNSGRDSGRQLTFGKTPRSGKAGTTDHGQRLPSPDRRLLADNGGNPLPAAGLPRLLQSYVWQDYDLAPCFPKLTDFLGFWHANLDGALYRIRVTHRRLITPAEFRFVAGELRLH
jgi:uncharacterized protein Usg